MKHDLDLYKDVLSEILSKHKIKIGFDNLKIENPNEIVEMTCYKTIQRIRKVLNNDTLDDFECIERIVKLLEGIGSDGGIKYGYNSYYFGAAPGLDLLAAYAVIYHKRAFDIKLICALPYENFHLSNEFDENWRNDYLTII